MYSKSDACESDKIILYKCNDNSFKVYVNGIDGVLL